MWHNCMKSTSWGFCFTPVEILELLESIFKWSKNYMIRKVNFPKHVVARQLLLLHVKLDVPGVSFWVQYKHPVGFLTPVTVFWMHPAEAYLGSPPTPWHPEETSLHTFTQPSVIQQDERVVAMAARFLCPLIHFCCFQTLHASSEGWRRNARKHRFAVGVRLCRRQVSFWL